MYVLSPLRVLAKVFVHNMVSSSMLGLYYMSFGTGCVGSSTVWSECTVSYLSSGMILSEAPHVINLTLLEPIASCQNPHLEWH